jgi:hypothetical protein
MTGRAWPFRSLLRARVAWCAVAARSGSSRLVGHAQPFRRRDSNPRAYARGFSDAVSTAARSLPASHPSNDRVARATSRSGARASPSAHDPPRPPGPSARTQLDTPATARRAIPCRGPTASVVDGVRASARERTIIRAIDRTTKACAEPRRPAGVTPSAANAALGGARDRLATRSSQEGSERSWRRRPRIGAADSSLAGGTIVRDRPGAKISNTRREKSAAPKRNPH